LSSLNKMPWMTPRLSAKVLARNAESLNVRCGLSIPAGNELPQANHIRTGGLPAQGGRQ